jgi:hypothetical protein
MTFRHLLHSVDLTLDIDSSSDIDDAHERNRHCILEECKRERIPGDVSHGDRRINSSKRLKTGCEFDVAPVPQFRAAAGESDAAFALRLQDLEQSQDDLCRFDSEFARRLQSENQLSDAGRSDDNSCARRSAASTAPLRASKQVGIHAREIDKSGPSSPMRMTLGLGAAQRSSHVSADLLQQVKPCYDCCGIASETLIFMKNIDGCKGRMVAEEVFADLTRLRFNLPAPRRGQGGGIKVEWHRNKRSQTPWRTGIKTLHALADQVMTYLRSDPELCHRAPAIRRTDRGWNDTEVLVTTPGCRLGRHRDAQPLGSLLLIFCMGLSCRSQTWPGGRLLERTLESGDVMIFDGRLTAHAVQRVIDRSSPLKISCLEERRMSVLVRQPPLPLS